MIRSVDRSWLASLRFDRANLVHPPPVVSEILNYSFGKARLELFKTLTHIRKSLLVHSSLRAE